MFSKVCYLLYLDGSSYSLDDERYENELVQSNNSDPAQVLDIYIDLLHNFSTLDCPLLYGWEY